MAMTGYNLHHMLPRRRKYTRRQRFWLWFGRRFQALAWWCDERAYSTDSDDEWTDYPPAALEAWDTSALAFDRTTPDAQRQMDA